MITKFAELPERDWRGRLDPVGLTRLYLRVKQVELQLPYPPGSLQLQATASTTALPDDQGIHREYPYFLQIGGLSSGDAMVALSHAVHTCLLWCDTAIELGPRVGHDSTGTFIFERHPRRQMQWGHYADTLPATALDAMAIHWQTVHRANPMDTFNPFANAFRLYSAALVMEPSDVALVSFVSALEGLFTTSADNISFRFALAIALFLEEARELRRQTMEQAKQVYTARSKTVHGASVSRDLERAAISLAESYTPLAEDLCRRSLRRLLELGLVDFVKNDRKGKRDQLFTLLALGYSFNDAAAELKLDLPTPGNSP